ncbi:uncharacterized protein LOC125674588 isoform X2 [Ostrea edulis]|uniref:uncharacterized protein LOC125674588 isoform X2 n=1 Tax=Ostrea edulis TaxID=37623 RepID=UPI0024AFB93E|nr:uncharacterized protein LOC125674588 isoform X2 [Ostrea edulis]
MKNKVHTLLLLVIWKKLVCVYCTRTCHASAATVQYVKSCPVNETEYNDRAKRKGCLFIGQDCTTADAFRYHCVLNSYGNASLEVCAPVWFLNGFCAEYNEDGKVIQDHYPKDCTLFRNPCPSRVLSTDSYIYRECYQDKKMKNMNQRRIITFPVRTVILGTIVFILLAIIFILTARQKIQNVCLKGKRGYGGRQLPNKEEIQGLEADELYSNTELKEEIQESTTDADDNTQLKDVITSDSYLEPKEN